jgi:hypothetical protein
MFWLPKTMIASSQILPFTLIPQLSHLPLPQACLQLLETPQYPFSARILLVPDILVFLTLASQHVFLQFGLRILLFHAKCLLVQGNIAQLL